MVDDGLGKRQAASTYLKTLASIGLLEERKVGREALFFNLALLTLLMSDDSYTTVFSGRRVPENSGRY
ncbi:hypothetical protein [Sphingopyxis sp.]|uniref:hypothetical protein n=1 Tax=Sphingopyxis sp. TaxID=1908224 RepID=UPI002FCC7522